MKKIALEEAMMPPNLIEKLGSHLVNKSLIKLKDDLIDLTAKRIDVMDEFDIEKTILSLTSPGLEGINDSNKTIDCAIAWNDHLAEGIANHTNRLRGFATLPMNHPEAAAKELERCIKELGFVGALVNGFTDAGGIDPLHYDDKSYLPFWQTIEKLDVPFYIHPRNPLSPKNQSEFYDDFPQIIGSQWGFHVETGEHALGLILSGLFDACPKLNIVIGHMGEMITFWARRVDHRLQMEKQEILSAFTGEPLKHSVEHYLRKNFHITTSGFFDDASLIHNIDVMGIDRICFSIDYPYEQTKTACDWFDKLQLSEADKFKIAYENAAKLLKI
ncbi:MAG: amidohydrolase family protein [Gammaproteobacteria bacterium]|nr:amidohydrolase family protein [Gammaproteobacteria bacterium]